MPELGDRCKKAVIAMVFDNRVEVYRPAEYLVAITKTELVRMISEKTGVQGKQVGEVLALLAEIAISETKQGGEFTVPGLGKLVKSERAARAGRNPATGESIQIAAKTTIKFRVAKAASDAIAATL